MTPLTQEQAEFVRQNGGDPALYQFDETAGDLVYVQPQTATKEETPGKYNIVTEALKSAGRGVIEPVADTVKFLGNTIGNIGEVTGLADPGAGRRSPITALGSGIEGLATRYMPESDEYAMEHPYIAGIAGGLGQAVGMLGPAGLARKYGMKAVKGIAAALGGGSEGEDALERSQARGDTAGEQLVKSLGSAVGSGLIEHKLGIGKIADKFLDPASKTIAEFAKRRLVDAGLGLTQGSAQKALQDMIVEGKTDFDSIVKEGGVEAIVQAILGGTVDVGMNVKEGLAAKAAADAAPIDTETSDFNSLAPDTVAAPWKTRELSDEYVQHILGQDDWSPVITTEFDDAIKEAKKRKILSRPLIEKLYEAPNPLQALDDIVRTPGGVPSAEPRVVLDADDLAALRNIKPDDVTPNLPLYTGIKELRKYGLPLEDSDLQALANAENHKKVVQEAYQRELKRRKPMDLAEVVDVINTERWEKLGDEYARQGKLISDSSKMVKQIEKDLNAAEKKLQAAEPGVAWLEQATVDDLRGKLGSAVDDLNKMRTDLTAKVLNHFNPGGTSTTKDLLRAPKEQQPAGTGNPIANLVSNLLMQQSANAPAVQPGAVPAQTAPAQPQAAAPAPTPTAPSTPAQTPEQRLLELQTQHGITEGYRIWEGEYGSPFVEPSVDVTVPAQVAAESDPKNWGDQPAENAGATRQMMLLPPGLDPVRLLYKALGSLTSSLGSHSAGHAYAAAKIQPLIVERNKLQNVAHAEHEKFKKFLADPDVFDAIQAGKYQPADFPAKWRGLVPAWNKFARQFQNIQNDRGIAVWAKDAQGRQIPRKAIHIPGYFWAKISQDVYDARHEGGPKWDKYKADYAAYWKQKNAGRVGRMTPAQIANEIQNDLDATFKSFAANRMDSGEPEFSAVRREHGIGLPPSWWEKDLNAATTHYINRFMTDIAYGTLVQNDPIMRRLFGIKEDAMGRPTAATDPKSFAQAGNRNLFETARKFGKRVGAQWESDPARVAAEFSKPFETITGNPTLASISNSYRQSPGSTGWQTPEWANSILQLAGNTLLQAPAAARDVGNATFTVYEYVPVSEWGSAIKTLMESIISPRQAIARSRRAGAQQLDVYAHEAAGVIGGAFGKAARAMRAFSGRNPADAWSKALVYNTIHDIVLNAESQGRRHSLVDEFVDGGRGNMTPAQLAQATANAITNRAQPAYDVRTLGPALIPQNRTLLGSIFSLSRWPVARFNTWYEDAWKPAMEGHPQRLLKSLLVGGLVGSVVTQELLSALTRREPQHLTLREWWRLPDDDKSMKSFAEMIFGYIAAQGSIGILGNILAEGARMNAGKASSLSGEIKLQYPPAIVAEKTAQTTLSFIDGLRDGTVGLHDIGEYGLELAKASQNFQVFEQWLGSKPEYRDRRIFEELTGQSAVTGDLKKIDTSPKPTHANPFSLNNRLVAAGTNEAKIKQLIPAMTNRAAAGSAIRIPREVMSPYYYDELARRRGIKEAIRQLNEDRKREAAAKNAREVAGIIDDLYSPPDISMPWPE